MTCGVQFFYFKCNLHKLKQTTIILKSVIIKVQLKTVYCYTHRAAFTASDKVKCEMTFG